MSSEDVAPEETKKKPRQRGRKPKAVQQAAEAAPALPPEVSLIPLIGGEAVL